MKVSRARASDPMLFRVMDRSRRSLGGPQIGSCGVGFAAGGFDWLVLGVRAPRLQPTSFAAGCRLGLRFRVGVVDPGAKRRIWD
jgi:hypothetical protein